MKSRRLSLNSILHSRHHDIRKHGLVKTLEELGIGRPSTYAPTLETIQKRGYVAIEEKKFMPTELGELVIEQMEQFFPEILNVEFTANMEGDLDHVEEGSEDWVKVLAEFYESFEKRLEFAEEEMKEIEIEDEVSDEICEKCGKPLVYKLGTFRQISCLLRVPGLPEYETDHQGYRRNLSEM